MELTKYEEKLLVEVKQADGVKDKIKLAFIVIDNYLTPQHAICRHTSYTPPSKNVTNQDSKRTARFHKTTESQCLRRIITYLCTYRKQLIRTLCTCLCCEHHIVQHSSCDQTSTPLHNTNFTGLSQPALSLTGIASFDKTGSRPSGPPPFKLQVSLICFISFPNPSTLTLCHTLPPLTTC